MGCGCNKNKTTNTVAAKPAPAPAVLLEVVDATGRVVYRTRDKRAAKQRVNSNTGWHYRKAGTTTPITD